MASEKGKSYTFFSLGVRTLGLVCWLIGVTFFSSGIAWGVWWIGCGLFYVGRYIVRHFAMLHGG